MYNSESNYIMEKWNMSFLYMKHLIKVYKQNTMTLCIYMCIGIANEEIIHILHLCFGISKLNVMC